LKRKLVVQSRDDFLYYQDKKEKKGPGLPRKAKRDMDRKKTSLLIVRAKRKREKERDFSRSGRNCA